MRGITVAGSTPFNNSPLDSAISEVEQRTAAASSAADGIGLPDIKVPHVPVAQRAPAETQSGQPGIPEIKYRTDFETAAKKYKVPVNALMALADMDKGFNHKNPAASIDGIATKYSQRKAAGFNDQEAIRAFHSGDDKTKWGKESDQYAGEVLKRAGQFGQFYTSKQTDPAAGEDQSLAGDVKQPAPERTWVEAFKDTTLAVDQGIAYLVGAGAWAGDKIDDALGTRDPNNTLAADAFGFAQHLEKFKSQKARDANTAVSEANGVIATAGALLDNPASVVDTIAQSAPMAIPGLGAGAIVARQTAVEGLKKGMTALAAREAARNAAIKAGVTAEVATTAGMGGNQANEQILAVPVEQLREKSERFRALEKTMGPEQARAQLAEEVSFAAAALQGAGTLVGGIVARKLGSKIGLGDPIGDVVVGTGKAATVKQAAKNLGGEVTEEVAQSGLEQAGQNVAMGRADNSVGVMDDVGKQALLGGVGGFGQSAAMQGGSALLHSRDMPAGAAADGVAPAAAPGAQQTQQPAAAGVNPTAAPVPTKPTKPAATGPLGRALERAAAPTDVVDQSDLAAQLDAAIAGGQAAQVDENGQPVMAESAAVVEPAAPAGVPSTLPEAVAPPVVAAQGAAPAAEPPQQQPAIESAEQASGVPAQQPPAVTVLFGEGEASTRITATSNGDGTYRVRSDYYIATQGRTKPSPGGLESNRVQATSEADAVEQFKTNRIEELKKEVAENKRKAEKAREKRPDLVADFDRAESLARAQLEVLRGNTAKPEPVVTTAPKVPEIVIQNRERSGASSIEPSAAETAAESQPVLQPRDRAREPIGGVPIKQDKVVTPAGREIGVEYRVVDASKLTTSNDDAGNVNKDYPQELQPRDRTRVASELQVNDIAKKLNPRLLGESPTTTDGAPIVSEDGVVESGNGRTLAIRRAYQQAGESAQKYREHLESMGADTAGMAEPMLVRVRTTPMDAKERADYTRESNERTTLAMGATERAKADATVIPNIIGDFKGGDLTAAANRDFVRKFVQGAVSSADRAMIANADGSLTQDGRRRIEAAILHAAYGNDTLVNDLFESSDSDIKAIGGALLDIAGDWNRMRAAADTLAAGVDITDNLMEAVAVVRRARAEGRSVSDLANNGDFFAGAMDPATTDILRIFYRGDRMVQARSRAAVADALKFYAEQALGTKAGEGLFGEEIPTVTSKDLLGATHEQIAKGERQSTSQSDFFGARTQPADENAGAPGGEGQRPQPAAGSEAPNQNILADEEVTPVEKPKAPEVTGSEKTYTKAVASMQAAKKTKAEGVEYEATELTDGKWIVTKVVVDGHDAHRVHPIERDAIEKDLDEMTPEELREALTVLRSTVMTSELTGLGSKKAWFLRKRHKFTASIDADSLKWVNDNLGHPVGDEFLKAIGTALNDSGVVAFHVSGDEFYATADDLKDLQEKLAKAQDLVKKTVLSSDEYDLTGVTFSFGIADDLKNAEKELKHDKERREAAGLRAGRGERPNGVVAKSGGNDGQPGEGQRQETPGNERAAEPSQAVEGALDSAWDEMSAEDRESIVTKAGWRTAAGKLNPAGRGIAKKSWEAQADLTKETLRKNYLPIRPGKVGDMLSPGQVVLTTTGRKTTPFPKNALSGGSNAAASKAVKAVDSWLMENAADEAHSRGDENNAMAFASNVMRPSQSDKDSAEMYLFDPESNFPMPKPLLKPLVPGPNLQKPEKPGYGDQNKLVKKEELDGLRSTIGNFFKNNGSTPMAVVGVLPPEVMTAAFRMSLYHVEAGARSFIDYSKAMIGEFGEGFRPYLKFFYTQVREFPGAEADGMTEAPTVDVLFKEIKEGRIIEASAEQPPAAEGANNAPGSSAGLERDSQDAGSRVGLREGDVSPSGEGTGLDARADNGAAGSEGDTGAGQGGLFDGGAVAGGTGGYSGLRPGKSAVPGGASKRGGRGGSGNPRREGISVERTAEEAVAESVEHPPVITDSQTKDADSVEIRLADIDNIRATLPQLLPEQQDDVQKAELRFAQPDAHGMLFTNGTGTGKTFTGLGVVKRFVRQGKTNILIAAPSQDIIKSWVAAGKLLGLDITVLDSTTSAGKGIVATTYANLGENRHLADRQWDLIVPDESHKLMTNEAGEPTSALKHFRAITNHPAGLHTRAHMQLRDLVDEINRLQNQSKSLGASDDERDWYARAGVDKDITDKSLELGQKAEALQKEFKAQPRSKVVMLSATPFAYDKNVDYAEGFLFEYPPESNGGYNVAGGRNAFMVQKFGYRMRYNKLTEPAKEVNSDVMERQFHDELRRSGALSGRRLEVDKDYDRKFILVDDAIGNKIDEAMTWLRETDNRRYGAIAHVVAKRFDYLSRMRLLEAIKARASIPYIKASLEAGRKVVVFHDYNEGGGFSPFGVDPFEVSAAMGYGESDIKPEALIAEAQARRPDIFAINFSGFKSPIETITAAFPQTLIYNGTISGKNRTEAKRLFNEDGSGRDIIMVQSAAGEAGISLHDVTGKHQRTLLNLGMPTRPTTALQIEGRTYRLGVMSDALFRYMNTGTTWERLTFAQKISERAATVENLALGDEARAIKQSFIDAFEASDDYPVSEGEGVGGKQTDRATRSTISAFDRAKSFYWAQQKNSKRRNQREGADYYATPEPIGFKMVEFAGIKPSDRLLEPSAGHGAIARFFPELNPRTLIEPSLDLASRAALASPGARMVSEQFEGLHLTNKYNAIVMNPPYGSGGKTAIEHVAKAAKHLRNGGRIVALLPRGGTADKRLADFLESEDAKSLHRVAEINLPSVTFERAGTSVNTRILVLEKHTDEESAAKVREIHADLSNAESVEELFNRIENIDMPARVEPATKEAEQLEEGDLVTAGGIEFRSASASGTIIEPTQRIGKDRFSDVTALARKNGAKVSSEGRGMVALLFRNPEQVSKFLAALEAGETASAAPAPSAAELDGYVRIAADSTEQLRKDDVERVLREAPTEKRGALAAHIQKVRPDLATEVSEASDELGVPAQQSAGALVADEFKHTKTGQPVFVARARDRVSREEFNDLRNKASSYGGHYSSFRGAGAIPGFHFKTAKARDQFMGSGAQDEGKASVNWYYSALERAVDGLKLEKGTSQQWKAMIQKAPGVKPAEIEATGITEWLDMQKGPVLKKAVQEFLKENGVQVEEVMHADEEQYKHADIQAVARRHGISIEEDMDGSKSFTDADGDDVYFDDLPEELQNAINNGVERELMLDWDGNNAKLPGGNIVSLFTDEETGRTSVEILDPVEAITIGTPRWFNSRAEAMAGARNYVIDSGMDSATTKFAAYQLPGGKKYRELLLTIPNNRMAQGKVKELPDGYNLNIDRSQPADMRWSVIPPGQVHALPFAGRHASEDAAISAALSAINDRNGSTYQSHHWNEKNVVAHIRFNSRAGKNGEKILHIEEIQSDWHQAGRKSGYRKGVKRKAEKAEHKDGFWHVVDQDGDFVTNVQDWEFPGITADRAIDIANVRLEENKSYQTAKDNRVPDAPFKGSSAWSMLAMKRVMRYAAENGYDAVTWTGGEAQAARYDLSKQIDRIEYERNPSDGTFNVEAHGRDGKGIVWSKARATEKEVADTVGKEIAEKMSSEDGDRIGGVGSSRKRLSGNGLKVGGKGMVGFYDQILPQETAKLIKRFDGKVERIHAGGQFSHQFNFDGKHPTIEDIENVGTAAANDIASRIADGNTFADAFDVAGKVYGLRAVENVAAILGGVVKQRGDMVDDSFQGFRLTDQMREVANAGVPLFSRKGQSTDGMTEEQATAEIRASGFGSFLDSGKVVLHQDTANFPGKWRGKAGVQAVTMADGTIHLAAGNVRPGAITSVMMHEAFHSDVKPLLGTETWGKLQKELAAMHRQASQSSGKMGQFFRAAADRIAIAESVGGKMSDALKAEEFGAYAIEEYESAPTVVKGWVDRVMGAVKAWLLARFGMQAGSVTPEQLRSIAAMALKNANTISVSRQYGYTGNDNDWKAGDFDPNNPDIRASVRRPDLQLPEEKRNRFSVPEETRGEKLQRYMQDRFNRVNLYQRLIGEQGGKVTEKSDVYKAEERYSGRVVARVEDFTKNEVKPFIKAVADADVTLDEVAEYAYAEHAAERNKYIQSINEKFDEGGGSGMTDEEADNIIAGYQEQGKAEKLASLAAMLRDIVDGTRNVIARDGLETPETVAAWESMFSKYVPLKGFQKVDEFGEPVKQENRVGLGGKGFSINGRETKHATGRVSKASEIIENIVSQRERAIIRAEKNKVAQSLLRLVAENPDPKLWAINEVTKKPVLLGNKPAITDIFSDQPAHEPQQEGRKVKYVSVRNRYDDNIVVVKVKGREVLVTIKDPILAEQLHMRDAKELPPFFSHTNAINRVLARLWTSLNPTFTVVNYARDIQTAALNALGETNKAVMADMLKYAAPGGWAMRATYQGMTDKDTEGAQWYERYRQAGGKTGFMIFGTLEDQKKKLDNMLRDARGDRNKAIAIGAGVIDIIETANSIIENAARLAIFRASIEHGYSEADAASLAKNLTVNFNRRGEWTHFFGALYLFFNPSVQGSTRVLMAVKRPKVQAALAGLVVGTFLLGMIGRALGGLDDDDEYFYDKIPTSIKDRNLVIMLPRGVLSGEKITDGGKDTGGRYIKIPMPYGYSVFSSIGNAIYDVGVAKKSPVQTASDLTLAASTSFNPVDTGTPTIFTPAVQIAMNRDRFGRQVFPEQSRFETPKPDSQKYFPSSEGAPAQRATEALNDITGGNKARPGYIDVSPETIEHIVSFVTGGLGTSIKDSVNFVSQDPEERDVTRLPFIKQVVGSQFKGQALNKFYENATEADITAAEREILQTAGDKEAMARFDKDSSWKLGFDDRASQLRKDLGGQRKAIRQIMADKSMSKADATAAKREISAQMDAAVTAFNRDWNNAEKAHE